MFIRWPSALLTAALLTVFGCAQAPASTNGRIAPPATAPPATGSVATLSSTAQPSDIPTGPSSQTLTGELQFRRVLLNDPDGYAYTLTETLDIQVRLRSTTPSDGLVADFRDDGSTLTFASDYTGTGTDPLCSEEDHAQATGTISSNGGTISALYSTGSSAPGSILLGFTFSYTGNHLILGGCEPTRANVAYVANGVRKFQYSTFGCDADNPTGLPVSSSASGRVFDFGCSNNAYTYSVGGQVSTVANSGTLALNP